MPGQPRLVSCARALVQHAFLDRSVNHGHSLGQERLSFGLVFRGSELLDRGPEQGPNTFVALSGLLGLAVSFMRRFECGQRSSSLDPDL